MLQPSIILLREGTDTSQGKPQLISNINACNAVVDTIRTTLGPRGMDKLVYESKGALTISNDGATILKLLDIVHPAAQTLVDIAKSQDEEVSRLYFARCFLPFFFLCNRWVMVPLALSYLLVNFLRKPKPLWKKVYTPPSSLEASERLANW